MESPTVTGAPAGSGGMRPQPRGKEGRAEPAPPTRRCRGDGRGPPVGPSCGARRGHGGGVGQGNGGTQATSVCRPVCPLCVFACVCVCLGALWAVLVAVRLGGRGSSDPLASAFTGRGVWLEGFDDVGSGGEAALPRTRG